MRGRTEERKRVDSKYNEISEIDKSRKEKRGRGGPLLRVEEEKEQTEFV
jgi:hypothetical protein